jgi:GAF domain-containing protein
MAQPHAPSVWHTGDMPMRATTVRFTEDLWALLEGEAGRDGVSAAQFVRDATIMRIAFTMGRRGDADLARTLDRLAGAASSGASDTLAAAVRDPERLAALRATGLLDSPPEPGFDRLTALASEILGAPVALVSLVAEDRQFFKSCVGLPEPWSSRRETPLSHSFCQHVVASREPLVVEDARVHPVLRDNLAIRDLGVVAYLGIPLFDARGTALGSLCVIDSRPRAWSADDVRLLRDVAGAVVTQIELTARSGDKRVA